MAAENPNPFAYMPPLTQQQTPFAFQTPGMFPAPVTKGFWASWGAVICIFLLTILALLLGYLYIFQSKLQPQEPAPVRQVTAADIVPPQQPPEVEYSQQQQWSPAPAPAPAQAQAPVVHNNTPASQVIGFDP